MRKEVAEQLKTAAEEMAVVFSNPEREYSNGETFKVDKINPLSEYVAAVVFQKTPSMKFAVGAAIYIKNRWQIWFPTDSHILGLQELAGVKLAIEQANFGLNFNKEVEK